MHYTSLVDFGQLVKFDTSLSFELCRLLHKATATCIIGRSQAHHCADTRGMRSDIRVITTYENPTYSNNCFTHWGTARIDLISKEWMWPYLRRAHKKRMCTLSFRGWCDQVALLQMQGAKEWGWWWVQILPKSIQVYLSRWVLGNLMFRVDTYVNLGFIGMVIIAILVADGRYIRHATGCTWPSREIKNIQAVFFFTLSLSQKLLHCIVVHDGCKLMLEHCWSTIADEKGLVLGISCLFHAVTIDWGLTDHLCWSVSHWKLPWASSLEKLLYDLL